MNSREPMERCRTGNTLTPRHHFSVCWLSAGYRFATSVAGTCAVPESTFASLHSATSQTRSLRRLAQCSPGTPWGRARPRRGTARPPIFEKCDSSPGPIEGRHARAKQPRTDELDRIF
jgi:hypothetical protein